MDRSRTEPSTPNRSTNLDLGGRYSLPRTNDIHLPVTDLLDIQKQWNIEGPRSIKRRKSLMTGDISTPGSARRSGPSTPRRSGDFNLTLTPRSRRSSIVVENTTKLNPEYEGPITLDFLRGFWNALDKDEQRKEEFRRRKANGSPQKDRAPMADESLLLPSNTDELLRSPETVLGGVFDRKDVIQEIPQDISQDIDPQNKSSQNESLQNENLEEDNPFIAPRTFSYLERILANQASRKRRASHEDERVSKKTAMELVLESPIIETSVEQEMVEQPLIELPIEQPAIEGPIALLPVLQDQQETQEEFPPIDFEFQPELLDQQEQDPGVGYVTPTSPRTDLIDEEFLVENPSNYEPIDEISTNFPPPRQAPPRIQNTRKRVPSSNTISTKMVKDLIQVLKPVDKRIKIDPEAYQYIQEQSDIFLLTLMGDLEAYALHRNRKGNLINIKDVLLYMTRLQSDKSGLEFSQLARNHLPLELLMALDNSLKEAVPSTELKGRKSEDDDLDYVSGGRHIERFSDSE